MSFRITTLLYLFALVAASLTVFGAWGILVSAMLLVLGGSLVQNPLTPGAKQFLKLCMAIAITVALCWLIIPDIGSRPASPANMSLNNMRQLSLAILNYESDHGHLPPPVVTDKLGNPLFSWRILMLPYLDADPIFRRLHLDKPWNSPHNEKILAAFDGSIFSSPRATSHFEGETNYFAVVGDDTVWRASEQLAIGAVHDNRTLLLMEVGGRGVHWSEPGDLSADGAVNYLTGETPSELERLESGYFISKGYSIRGRWGLFLDGHGEPLGPLKDRSQAKALLTANGGESIPDELELSSNLGVLRPVKIDIHWPHIWGVTVWLALVLLPFVPAARHRIWPSSDRAPSPSTTPISED